MVPATKAEGNRDYAVYSGLVHILSTACPQLVLSSTAATAGRLPGMSEEKW